MDQTIDINVGSSRHAREARLPASQPQALPPPPLPPRPRSRPFLPFLPFLPCRAYLQSHPCLPFRACLPFRPFRACLPFHPFRAFLRILHKKRVTLHLRGVKATEAFVGLFSFLVLIDPLGPIDLDVLVLVLGLEETGPEGSGGVQLLEDEDEVEASLGPLGGSFIDGFVELEGEGVFLSVAVSSEGEGGLSEVDVVVRDVPQLHLQVHAFLPLRPLRDRVTEQQTTYSIC